MSERRIDLFRPRVNLLTATAAVDAVLAPDAEGRVYIGQGQQVDAFEEELQRFLRCPKEVLTLNSCTSALDLSLHLAGVQPDAFKSTQHVVISTPMTCTATNSPAVTRGARILWADVDPTTGLIDPRSVRDRYEMCREKLKVQPAAVIAVDWGGQLCDYGALREAAPGVPIIQDAAHSFGAEVGGLPFLAHENRRFGEYVCFSFQAIKHLTAGDGGALVIMDRVGTDKTERARLLRWYGLDRRSKASFRCEQLIEEVGYKYHMNDIAAALGRSGLPYVQDTLMRQHTTTALYTLTFQGLASILPAQYPWNTASACWLYTLLVSDRADFTQHMQARGIDVSPVHARNDVHPGFQRRAVPLDAPLRGVDYFAAHEVAIPVGWWLTDEDKVRVIAAVLEWARKAPPLPDTPGMH